MLNASYHLTYKMKKYINFILCHIFGHKWEIHNYSDAFIDFRCKRCIINGKPLIKRYFKKNYKQLIK